MAEEVTEISGEVQAQSWLSGELKKVGVPEINLKNPAGIGGIASDVLTNGLKAEVAKKAFAVLDSDTLAVIASAATSILADRANAKK